MINKLKTFLSVLFIVPALYLLYRKLTATAALPETSPNDAERKLVEEELEQTEKELEELNGKVYTDSEIEEKWNK